MLCLLHCVCLFVVERVALELGHLQLSIQLALEETLIKSVLEITLSWIYRVQMLDH